MEPELFNKIKALFGTLDDLCQQRRRIYTGWASQRTDPSAFVEELSANLRSTREAAEALQKLIGPRS